MINSFEEWCEKKITEQHDIERDKAINRMYPEQKNKYLDPWYGW